MTHKLNPDQVPFPVQDEMVHHDRDYFRQLKRKMRWRLLAAYIMPLALIAGFFHYQHSVTTRTGIDNHLMSVAENQRNTVDLFLEERVANLRSAFQTPLLSIPPSDGDLAPLLARLRHESAAFVDVGLFSPDGTHVAYGGPHDSLRGKNYRDEAWWRRLMDQQQDRLISDVYLGFRGRPHFIIAVRRQVDGNPWVLRASVDPQNFTEFVQSSYLDEQAEAFIVNAAGQRQTLGGESVEEPAPIAVPPRSATAVVREVEDGGRRYLSAFAWLHSCDWVLTVRVPKAQAYAPVRQTRLVSAGIILLTLALLVVLVVTSTRRLVGKLETADRAREDLIQQLFHAAKLASVGEVAAGVAHEINNPLAVIYEEAGMMQDTLDPQFNQPLNLEEFREQIGVIMDAAIRGRTITRKLLAFARQHEPDPEPTDINRLVRRVVEAREAELTLSNIEVRTDFSEGLPEVLVNRNLMDQVLLNLVNNARDAIDGRGVITIRTRCAAGQPTVAVRDTGCGMTAEQMKKIFFPFYTTKEVGKGTGLGLSISYGIMKSMGGGIEVESEPGKGTTFTLLIPHEAKAAAGKGTTIEASEHG